MTKQCKSTKVKHARKPPLPKKVVRPLADDQALKELFRDGEYDNENEEDDVEMNKISSDEEEREHLTDDEDVE